MDKEKSLQLLVEAILDGDSEKAKQIAEESLAAGVSAMELINDGIVVASDRLGNSFQEGELFLPELVQGGNAAKAIMAVVQPHITGDSDAGQSGTGKVVLGSVAGDMHDIGKNLVATMLSARGFDVYDLGIDVDSKAFLSKAEEVGADIIALSSLMSTSLYFQQDIIEYLEAYGKRNKYFVIVGGGPVTPDWAKEIKSDGAGRTAADAVELCVTLLDGKKQAPLSELIVLPNTGW
jgi:methylmalonyl-CoA mutase cobalamin-binding domain/chain